MITHQESIAADLKAQQDRLLAAAIPNSNEKSDELAAHLAELQAKADAEREEKLTACRKIESLMLAHSRLVLEMEHLQRLRGIAESSEVNARQAAEQFVIGHTSGEGYAIQNYRTITDEMLRAAAVAPVIPALLAERADAIKASQTEIQTLVKRFGIDIAALVETLKQQRGLRSDLVYIGVMQ